jgi:hypothetical protein
MASLSSMLKNLKNKKVDYDIVVSVNTHGSISPGERIDAPEGVTVQHILATDLGLPSYFEEGAEFEKIIEILEIELDEFPQEFPKRACAALEHLPIPPLADYEAENGSPRTKRLAREFLESSKWKCLPPTTDLIDKTFSLSLEEVNDTNMKVLYSKDETPIKKGTNLLPELGTIVGNKKKITLKELIQYLYHHGYRRIIVIDSSCNDFKGGKRFKQKTRMKRNDSLFRLSRTRIVGSHDRNRYSTNDSRRHFNRKRRPNSNTVRTKNSF